MTQLKNFISYINYGLKNRKLNLIPFIVNVIFLIYALLELNNKIISTINNRTSLKLLVIFLFNFVWQCGEIIVDFMAYFNCKMYSEQTIQNIDYSDIISSDQQLEKIGDIGITSYNPNLCEAIRTKTFMCVNDKQATKKVNSYIKTHFNSLFPFLCNHFKSITFNGKIFCNDLKLCLSDMIIENSKVRICKGCYYNTYLTNKVFSKALFLDESPTIYAPYCGIYKNIKLPFEYFSNEIGVSTLAITSDGFLFFQQQGSGADSSTGLIVPSGSGSADWSDYHKNCSLQEIISISTNRELSEEIGYGGKNIDKIISNNKVLGIFRWLNFGGKPEFVSITKLCISFEKIHPLRSEQHFYIENSCRFRIINNGNIDYFELEKCWEMMNNPKCSVPLYMNLKIFKEYLSNEVNKNEFIQFMN